MGIFKTFAELSANIRIMYIEQLYTNCLAEAAYYIESNGEAAIIDPIRETEPYLELAAKRGATIKYIFETHFHADFVSGHIDLSKKTGATIIYGPMAETKYKVVNAKDGEILDLNGLKTIVIGGAYSVDKFYRIKYHHGWWEQEQPSEEIKQYVEMKLEPN